MQALEGKKWAISETSRGVYFPSCSGKEGVIVDVVDRRGSIGLGVYRGRRGGRNSKYRANKASQNITRQYAVLGMP